MSFRKVGKHSGCRVRGQAVRGKRILQNIYPNVLPIHVSTGISCSTMAGMGVSLLIVPPLLLLVLLMPLLLLSCVICKKRQTEGTYRPSDEEHKQTQSHAAEHPGLPLPMPKKERLI
ncbi:hypothetical protein P4O66_021637 [Electrophorus voltai]|uniref:Crumbs homolog 3b n=1 Tax=Electrophorus voltai TaxID=2609070 RepID=A0AAD8ZPJ4_9TELE|nr:hypothetical protein P4O66_021637 [Electrophorus voltai]